VTELCPSPALLAQQLTHVELERLSYIGPEEFVQAFAKENPHLETSFKDMKKTRNLESYVQWFNRLSYFVATEVCKVTDSVEVLSHASRARLKAVAMRKGCFQKLLVFHALRLSSGDWLAL
jgi:hypothetical protein